MIEMRRTKLSSEQKLPSVVLPCVLIPAPVCHLGRAEKWILVERVGSVFPGLQFSPPNKPMISLHTSNNLHYFYNICIVCQRSRKLYITQNDTKLSYGKFNNMNIEQ